MEFRLLGDIEAYTDGEPLVIGYAQLRCVLAVLLVDANHTVSVDQIVDRVWGAKRRLPRSPRGAVQHSVAMLRRVLARGDAATITYRSNGYRIAVDADAVDMHRFQALLGQARIADRDEHASDLFERALLLWRGEPFTGLDTPWLGSVRGMLVTQRRAAQLDLHDVQLRLGRHAALLPDLSDEIEQYPLDERLAGQYLLALYRSGRQADALEHYERLRHRLADALGADPSPPLRLLHQQILTFDPALAAPAHPVAAVVPSPLPRQLPLPPRSFVGRARELDLLDATLLARPASICAIAGAGGMGKTCLALHWAHQRRDRFPDGQLYVNLRGFDPTGRPMDPEAAIRGFLAGLGVDTGSVPADLDAQAALYRSLVADRRMLIVLDNARDSAQLGPLLPGTSACAVLVTSRDRLAGLVTVQGARPVPVDVLSDAEARQLLTGRLGPDRVTADADAVAELVRCCGGLPLALSIVAGQALIHPDFPLSVPAADLRDATTRLRALDDADPTASLPAVLSTSLLALQPATATVFGRMALAPGPDIGADSVAVLAGAPATDTLRELENASLVQQHAPGRYRIHDLLRLHAVAHADDGPATTHALRRLVDAQLHTAYAADRLLEPHRDPIDVGPPPADATAPADEAAALAWFAAEHANLLAAQRLAAERGWHAPAWQLAWALNTFHYRHSHLSEDLQAAHLAVQAADELDDPAARTQSYRLLAYAAGRAEQNDVSAKYLGLALTLAEQTGDVAAQAHTHHALSWTCEIQGDDPKALAHAAEGLRLFRELADVSGQALALNAVGWYEARLGHYEQAAAHCAEARTLFHDQGDRDSEAATLDSLGYIAHRAGEYRRAIEYYEQARAAFHELANAYEEATTLDHLGEAHQALGATELAHRFWRQALEYYETQDRRADADRIRQSLA